MWKREVEAKGRGGGKVAGMLSHMGEHLPCSTSKSNQLED